MKPIYKKEMSSGARRYVIPTAITITNAVLAAIALIYIYGRINPVQQTGQVDYGSFLNVFSFIVMAQYAMIILVTPALTCSSISYEKQAGTWDLMMTTKVRPSDVIIGKLLVALSHIAIVIVSGLPILALSFMYGGIVPGDILMICICFVCAALLTASIGLFFSSALKKSALCAATSYIAVLLILFMPYVFSYARSILDGTSVGIWASARVSIDGSHIVYDMLGAFSMVIERVTGTDVENFIPNSTLFVSLGLSATIQILVSAILIISSIKIMERRGL